MSKKRRFLTRLEAVRELDLTDARTNAEKAKKCNAKLAISVGGVVYEAEHEETLHSEIVHRVIKQGALGSYIEGWACDDEVAP